MGDRFRVGRIDHVELVVPNHDDAIEWYTDVLGFEICHKYDHWTQDGGPVTISSDGGETMLALFEGDSRQTLEPSSYVRVAFQVTAADFLTFLDRSKELPLYDRDGTPLDHPQVVDFEPAFSIFFCDPFGNPIEITTYEYDTVADQRRPAEFLTN